MNEQTEKEKILIIFTICFLHFYTNFSYENNFSFEDYFNQNLINLCTKYNVFVKDIKQFKIFCYSFYYQLIKEIKYVNYLQFKNMYSQYNPATFEEEKLIFGENNLNVFNSKYSNKETNLGAQNTLSYLKKYITNFYNLDKYDKYRNLKSNFQKIVNKKIMTPLISTTERIVDMIDKKAMNVNISTNSNTNSISEEEMDVDKISNNNSSISGEVGNITSQISLNAPNTYNYNPQEDVIMNSSTVEDSGTKSIPKQISKRILCELIKTDINEKEKEIAYEISKKLDFLIDIILNRCENKTHFIQLFMCYIVEINSEIIRMLPEYEKNTEDFNMRFIISSKNIYNYALEVYFSLYDLYNIDVNTFMDVFKKKFPLKFEESIGKSVLFFYKIINDEILKSSNKGNIEIIIGNAYNETLRLWEIEIVEKGQELKRFCAV